jgi:phenylpropionate dioxygenase-like ring-hydroxylating dioxygenase large terminal subunit
MNMSDRKRTAPGDARSPGITYQQLLDTDTHPVPAVLRLESPKYLGSQDYSIDRYITKEWHDLEVEYLWKRVWQFACREDDVPEIGDYHVYDIAGMSFLIVRGTDGSIKCYPNACLHRGRRLKDYDGHCSELRCAFHAFAWTIDGELKHVPARWDFPHVEDDQFHLPEVRVGTWQGFVFINPDTDAEPFEDFVAELAEQFDGVWDLGNYYTEAHIAKVCPANWKVVQEAFCEAYHVSGTHPQILPYLGDTNSQVDIWENCSRVITAGGTPSPLMPNQPTQEEMLRAMLDTRVGDDTPIKLGDNQTMRALGAELSRTRWRSVVGDRVDQMSDAEMMDSLDYTLFPNMHPWGAFNRIVYRFRPNGHDHRTGIMECFFLSPYSGDTKPKPAKPHWLTDSETFSDAQELGMLGKVFDQDLFNMPNVQRGLESTFKPGVTLADYQESKVRWLHDKLTEWVEVPATAEGKYQRPANAGAAPKKTPEKKTAAKKTAAAKQPVAKKTVASKKTTRSGGKRA